MFETVVKSLSFVLDIIYQTRKTVFHRDIQTPRRELKYYAQRSIFDEIRGVRIVDETLSLVVDMLHQTRETVFHWDIQTPRRELKILRTAKYF